MFEFFIPLALTIARDEAERAQLAQSQERFRLADLGTYHRLGHRAALDLFANGGVVGPAANYRPTVCEYCKSPHSRRACPNCGGPA